MIYQYALDGHTHMLAVGGRDGPIRIILHESQMSLIGFLSQIENREVEVCSLNYITTALQNPKKILSEMTAVPSNAYGGWRLLKETEYSSMFMSMCNPNSIPPPIVSRHPFVRAGGCYATDEKLTFPLIALLREIADIHRFTNPHVPLSPNLLKNYFRMTNPHATHRIVQRAKLRSDGFLRALVLFTAWFSSPKPVLGKEAALASPTLFLFRDYYQELEEQLSHHPVEQARGLAFWRVSARYLTFIRNIWFSGLGIIQFEPERFFTRQDEVEGFRIHIKELHSQVDNSCEGSK